MVHVPANGALDRWPSHTVKEEVLATRGVGGGQGRPEDAHQARGDDLGYGEELDGVMTKT
jgi:hypothetical protein